MDSIFSWILGNWELITAIIGFGVYFGLNKRQKRAEVKTSEGSALTTMQGAYDEFTKDYMDKWTEVKDELDGLKKSDKEKGFVIEDLKRQTKGLTREVGQLKTSLSEVEGIACVKLACVERDPASGKYKHKKEAR